MGRGCAAGDRVPAGGVLGGGVAWRAGGAGYLSLKQFRSSRRSDGLGRTNPYGNGFVLVGRVRTVGDAVPLEVMLIQNLVGSARKTDTRLYS